MEIEIVPDPAAAALRSAQWMADAARRAVAERGLFTAALSGGGTPTAMLKAMVHEDIPWPQVHLFQIDERAAPEGHADRNFTAVREYLLSHVELPEAHVHPMPVALPDPDAPELDPESLAAAAERYAAELAEVTGSVAAAGQTGVLDVAHLGIGPDGHFASLVPGDPGLEVTDRDVITTAPYKGRRRMTLTYPAIERAREALWVVVGEGKAEALAQLVNRDPAIPAGRLRSPQALVIADAAAASRLG